MPGTSTVSTDTREIANCTKHSDSVIPTSTTHDGIVAGCTDAAATSRISWALIPDVSPHLGAAACESAMDEVLAYDLDHIVAVGMGGPADTWWTEDFSPIYDKARSFGLPVVAHAAEHGEAAEVRVAIENFQAVRIQHGVGVMRDPAVVRMLVERGVACDVCPGSNLALGAAHPLPAMLDAGITVTLGSNDPPMFQTTLLDEYERAWHWAGLDLDGIEQLARNSLDTALVDR